GGGVVVRQFQFDFLAHVCRQGLLLQQVRVDAGSAVEFAALAEQARQAKVGIDGVGVDVEAADKNVDRLVGLFVEQEVEAAHVVVGETGQAITMALASAQSAHGVADRYGDEKQGQPDWLFHRYS